MIEYKFNWFSILVGHGFTLMYGQNETLGDSKFWIVDLDHPIVKRMRRDGLSFRDISLIVFNDNTFAVESFDSLLVAPGNTVWLSILEGYDIEDADSALSNRLIVNLENNLT